MYSWGGGAGESFTRPGEGEGEDGLKSSTLLSESITRLRASAVWTSLGTAAPKVQLHRGRKEERRKVRIVKTPKGGLCGYIVKNSQMQNPPGSSLVSFKRLYKNFLTGGQVCAVTHLGKEKILGLPQDKARKSYLPLCLFYLFNHPHPLSFSSKDHVIITILTSFIILEKGTL